MSPPARLLLIQHLREMFYGPEAYTGRIRRLLNDPESKACEVYGRRRLGSRTPQLAETDR